MNSIKTFFNHSPWMQIPKWGSASFQVWYRNFYYFRKTWQVSLFWILLEPLFYLVAIGFGLGIFVNDIQGVSYVDFFFSALLCTTAMMVAFFESTYGNYTKLTHQKTYAVMLLSPIEPQEIAVGEILWSAFKGFLSAVGVAVIAAFLGLTNTLLILPALLILVMISWIFSCFGTIMTTYAKNYDSFIYTTSGVIIPMSLFSGTYFPLEQLPAFFKFVAYLLPLTHAVDGVRALLNGQISWMLAVNFLVLVVYTFFMTNFAVHRMNQKILS